MTERELEHLYEEYREYAAEARACGYEVETFNEWLGESRPRETAEAKYAGLAERDELDLY